MEFNIFKKIRLCLVLLFCLLVAGCGHGGTEVPSDLPSASTTGGSSGGNTPGTPSNSPSDSTTGGSNAAPYPESQPAQAAPTNCDSNFLNNCNPI